MKRTAAVCIDHATIYCKDKERLNEYFASLGFYSKHGVHYMTRNSYFEFYQPGPGESYGFFQSEAGLHSFIFWSDDSDQSYQRVTGAGYVTAMPVSLFDRPADHGEPRGQAHFKGFYMQTPLLPVGETAVVQQMDPQLIYPAQPYPHPNGVTAMDKMYLCVEDEGERAQVGEELERFCGILKEGWPVRNCIRTLELDGAADFARAYGAQVDPARSCCVGIRFLSEDMEALRGFVESSGLPWQETGEGELCVDLTGPANLFLVFARR